MIYDTASFSFSGYSVYKPKCWICFAICSASPAVAGTRGKRTWSPQILKYFSAALIPAGFPSAKASRVNSSNCKCRGNAVLKSPLRHNLIIAESCAGKAFPITEITPLAPRAIIGNATGSSPEIIRPGWVR